jgi:hypothetical protein
VFIGALTAGNIGKLVVRAGATERALPRERLDQPQRVGSILHQRGRETEGGGHFAHLPAEPASFCALRWQRTPWADSEYFACIASTLNHVGGTLRAGPSEACEHFHLAA